jgi:hypothetical protein
LESNKLTPNRSANSKKKHQPDNQKYNEQNLRHPGCGARDTSEAESTRYQSDDEKY